MKSLNTNPARPNRTRKELPEHHSDRDRQFRSVETRDALLRFLNERARAAVDESADNRDRAFRDRAVVTMLALTGVRGAELFDDPRDDHRNGFRWADVDLNRGVVRVFSRTREQQPIPPDRRVFRSLKRYRNVLNPATEDRPVFPTRHHPSLARAVKNGRREQGWEDDAIESALDDATTMTLPRDHEIALAALSKNPARTMMKRLCESLGIETGGEYLKPLGDGDASEAISTLETPSWSRKPYDTSRSKPPTSPTRTERNQATLANLSRFRWKPTTPGRP